MIIILPFLKHKYQEQSKLLYSIIIYFLIPLSFLVFVVNYRYLFQLIPILFILSSLSIITLYEDIKKSENKIIYFIVITVLCLSLGYISFLPKNFYYLESDIPGETWGKRSYYLYTPQPNWNGAYEYIKENLKPDDLIISSEPVFTKIFLNQKGYYLAYNRDNSKNNPVDKDISGKEYYVGATIINNISQIDNLLKTKHGFIVFDSLFANKSSSQDFMNYLFKFKKLKSSYSNERNKISQIVVFKF